MERGRDGRMARRRHDGGSSAADRERERRKMDRERKRRRGDRRVEDDEEEGLNYSSFGDEEEEDDDEEEAEVSGRLPGPPTPPPSSSLSPSHGCGGGHPSVAPLKKGYSLPPAPWRSDDVIGDVVPRRTRSASANRMSHKWLMLSGGHGNGASTSDGGGNGHHRQPSASASPSSNSGASPSNSGAPVVRKKLKLIGREDKETKPRPTAVTLRIPKPPRSPRPPQEEAVPDELLEAAEVLTGLTQQFRPQATKPEPPAATGSPANPTSATDATPKRKRPRSVKHDGEEDEKTENEAVPSPPPATNPPSPAEHGTGEEEKRDVGIDLTAPPAGKHKPSSESDPAGDGGHAKAALDLELESSAATPAIAEAPKPDGDGMVKKPNAPPNTAMPKLEKAAIAGGEPTKRRRCATHCYIAKMIQQQQQQQQELAKVNPCWPPPPPSAMAMAAVVAAANAAMFYGPLPFGAAVAPPAVDPPAVAKQSQPKQAVDQETRPPPVPVGNMLPGAPIYFPISPQQAAAASHSGAVKSTGGGAAAGNVMPPSAPMNLSFAGLPPPEAQYMAILQSGGYPIAVPTHAGGAVSANAAQAIPFFNIPFYPPHVLQSGPQPQLPPKNGFPGGSAGSSKHQAGFGPSVASANAQFFPGQKSNHDHKYAAPGNPQNFNFTLMPSAAGAAPLSGNAKQQQQQHQQQSSSRVQKASAAPEPFAVSFGSLSVPGAAAAGLELSSPALNNAAFQGHQDACSQGHPFFGYAAGAAMPAMLPKSAQFQLAREEKLPRDSPAVPGMSEHDGKKPFNFTLSDSKRSLVQDSAHNDPASKAANFMSVKQQQGQMKQMQQQQQQQLSSSSANVVTSFPSSLMSLPQVIGHNNGIPGQPSHWTLTSKGTVAAPAKNSNLFQQQSSKPGQQAIPNSSQQKKVPAPFRPSNAAGDASRSSNATGSPSNSVSRSTGGNSPAAAGSAPVKSSATSSKPAGNHYNMPSILGQQQRISPQNFVGNNEQKQLQKQAQGSHFMFSAYQGGGKQQLPNHPGMLSLASMPMPDPGKAPSSAAGKVLLPYPGILQAPSFGRPPAAGLNQRYMALPPLSVKPGAEQKPANGS